MQPFVVVVAGRGCCCCVFQRFVQVDRGRGRAFRGAGTGVCWGGQGSWLVRQTKGSRCCARGEVMVWNGIGIVKAEGREGTGGRGFGFEFCRFCHRCRRK